MKVARTHSASRPRRVVATPKASAAVAALSPPTIIRSERERLHGEIFKHVRPLKHVQTDFDRLLRVHGEDAIALTQILATIQTGAYWSNPQSVADERAMFAACIDAAPRAPTQANLTPFSAGIVDVKSDGTNVFADPLAALQTALSHDTDMLLLPEWALVPPGQLMTAGEFDAFVDAVAAMSADSHRLIVPGSILWHDRGQLFSTSIAVSDGKVLCELDKRGDGGEVDIAAKFGLTFSSRAPGATRSGHTFVPGTFGWRGMRMGLEICRDHGDARMRSDLLLDARGVVDAQLVVSSGVWIKQPVVGTGGVILLAQGDQPMRSEAMQSNDNNDLQTLTPEQTVTLPLDAPAELQVIDVSPLPQ